MTLASRFVQDDGKLYIETMAGSDLVEKKLLYNAKKDERKKELIIRLCIDWYTYSEFVELWNNDVPLSK